MNSVTSNIQSLADKADVVRERAAESLESAAQSVRAGAGAISDLANDAGRKLNATAAFVRPCGDGEKLNGLRNSIRRNPMSSLVIATAVGVVAGFACRKS
jgi:ElaB/YqjD/DUF883 family membrane-anchored ribosome-binding protein